MHGKRAWVVTDWMNGACGMERKETTEAVGCWGECMKWKRNEMQGFGVRNERSSWNVMGWNECTDRKHMDKSTRNVFIFLHNYRAVGKYWGSLFFGANSTQKWKTYHWKCVGKGLGENGMNGACEMEMSISRSRGVLKCMIGMKV